MAAHSKRQIIRGGLLALATPIPLAFVVYSNHERQTVGVDWVGAIGALVALSLVIAVTVAGSRQLVADKASPSEDDG